MAVPVGLWKSGVTKNQFNAILHKHSFERIDIQTDVTRASGVRFDADGQSADTRRREKGVLLRDMLGFSSAIESPGRRNALQRRSSDCWHTVRDQKLFATNLQPSSGVP